MSCKISIKMETITVSIPNDDSTSIISQPSRVSQDNNFSNMTFFYDNLKSFKNPFIIYQPTSMKQLDLEGAKDILAELALTSVQFGDYLVIMNSDFDMIISEEPYHALTLLIDITSWKYMARIWSSTVSTGNADSYDKFQDLCRDHFCEKCGYSASEKGHLKKHMANVHKIGEEFKCEQCQHISFGKHNLQRHIKKVHERLARKYKKS